MAQLNRRIGQKLDRWGTVWVEGEVSDATHASSGHVYFTLNDALEPAQIRVVMFSGDARRRRAKLANGERVRIQGGFTMYEPRGSFQLVARLALPAGEGDRREQIERLKKKLAAEGLLAPERKRPLPRVPTVVGLVTSKAGAAWRDVVRVARGRAPVRLVLADCRVQGPEAPRTIVAALRRVAKVPGLDVVIVTRGGGASEDLGAFNDEAVARAIAACPVPVVCGVGHEVDDTVADLVADVRAATPSNAAELVVPEREGLERELAMLRRRAERALERDVGRGRLSLERYARRLQDPRHLLGRARRRFSEDREALVSLIRAELGSRRTAWRKLDDRLRERDPRARLAAQRARFESLAARLRRLGAHVADRDRRALEVLAARLPLAITARVDADRVALARAAGKLDALSPLKVLGRGYAIVLAEDRAVLDAAQVQPGARLDVRVARGRLEAEVTAVHEEDT